MKVRQTQLGRLKTQLTQMERNLGSVEAALNLEEHRAHLQSGERRACCAGHLSIPGQKPAPRETRHCLI